MMGRSWDGMKNVIKPLYQNYRLACIFNGCSSGNALLEQRVFAVTQRSPDLGRLSQFLG